MFPVVWVRVLKLGTRVVRVPSTQAPTLPRIFGQHCGYWWLGASASVATVLSTHPCIVRCLWVEFISLCSYFFHKWHFSLFRKEETSQVGGNGGLNGSLSRKSGTGENFFFYCNSLSLHCCHLCRGNVYSQSYRQVSDIRCTSEGNKFVDHSDVVGASPVHAAPTTSSFLT